MLLINKISIIFFCYQHLKPFGVFKQLKYIGLQFNIRNNYEELPIFFLNREILIKLFDIYVFWIMYRQCRRVHPSKN